MDIKDWHEKLNETFILKIKDSRTSLDSGARVFALEHSLNQSEIKKIFLLVNQCFEKKLEIENFWLPLVVASTEIGYSFAGDEYWQTFERELSCAVEYKNRNLLRNDIKESFKKFSNDYYGVKISGRWAKNFNIIAWPITHSILPLDLQWKFLEALFKIRFSLREDHFYDEEVFAKELEARSLYSSSRFKYFLQNRKLIWQFTSALLSDHGNQELNLLSLHTLERIIEDLEREKSLKEWLKETRQKAYRFVTRGTSKGKKRLRTTSSSSDADSSRYNFSPQLLLQSEDDKYYNLWATMPKFGPYLSAHPDLQEKFLKYRFLVEGSETVGPLPSAQLLKARRSFKLTKYPDSKSPLLKPINNCVVSEVIDLYEKVKIDTTGPGYLFKLRNDGSAFYVRSGALRPKNTYIFISENEKLISGKGRQLSLGFNGAIGTIFDVDENSNSPFTDDELQRIGLCETGFLNIWPAGVPPSQWDGEGFIEWLSTDTPILGMQSSEKINNVQMEIAGIKHKSFSIPSNSGQPVFIEFPKLIPGTYLVNFLTQSSATELDKKSCEIEISIREPLNWERGSSPCNPFMISIDPLNPNYEELMESKLDIHIEGPIGLDIEVETIFYDKSRKKILLKKSFRDKFPISPEKWPGLFEQHIRHKVGEGATDDAHLCKVVFKGEELGTASISFERELTALRWRVKRSSKKFQIRLIDDTDSIDEFHLSFYGLNTPDICESLDFDDALNGIDIGEKEGLFFAKANGNKAGLIVKGMPPKPVHSFEDFVKTPKIVTKQYRIDQISEILNSLRQWHKALIENDWRVKQAKRHVILELTRCFFGAIGGRSWYLIECENDSSSETYPLVKMFNEIVLEWKFTRIAKYIRCSRWQLADLNPSQRIVRFATSLEKFSIVKKELEFDVVMLFSEFCLKLASSSADVFTWPNEQLDSVISKIKKYPAVPLLARYLVLSIDKTKNSKEAVPLGVYHPLWRW